MIRWILMALFFGAAAHAGAASLEVTFDQSVQTASPGDTLTFTGLLKNPGPIGTAPLFPNADVLTVDLPLTGDDSLFVSFLLEIPFPTLGPGEQVSMDFFTADVPLGTPSGTYAGAFDVLGGESPDAMDLLGEALFSVRVVPEPGVLTLFALVAGLGLGREVTRKQPGAIAPAKRARRSQRPKRARAAAPARR